MQRNAWIWIGCCIAAAGCGDDAATDAGAEAEADGSIEVEPPDGSPPDALDADAVEDAVEDAGPDAVEDADPDVAPPPDALDDTDGESGCLPDPEDGGTEPDAEDVFDAEPDVAEDVFDAEPDVAEDVFDAEPDVAEDVFDAEPDVADVPDVEDVEDATDAGDDGAAWPPCPPDMVEVGSFCLDRYEASRPDATATDAGVDSSRATSRAGVIPWSVNPMTTEALATFSAACAAAGKRMCRPDEWFEACTGPSRSPYAFGSTWDREICNCVDTFCDDYCVEHGIPSASCAVGENCGYTYYCFHVVATGSMAACTSPYGAFDVNGNLWEAVPSTADGRGFEIRGGAFNCAWPSERLRCTFNAAWNDLFAGFRCCKDR
jgi:hypothetical protein